MDTMNSTPKSETSFIKSETLDADGRTTADRIHWLTLVSKNQEKQIEIQMEQLAAANNKIERLLHTLSSREEKLEKKCIEIESILHRVDSNETQIKKMNEALLALSKSQQASEHFEQKGENIITEKSNSTLAPTGHTRFGIENDASIAQSVEKEVQNFKKDFMSQIQEVEKSLESRLDKLSTDQLKRTNSLEDRHHRPPNDKFHIDKITEFEKRLKALEGTSHPRVKNIEIKELKDKYDNKFEELSKKIIEIYERDRVFEREVLEKNEEMTSHTEDKIKFLQDIIKDNDKCFGSTITSLKQFCETSNKALRDDLNTESGDRIKENCELRSTVLELIDKSISTTLNKVLADVEDSIVKRLDEQKCFANVSKTTRDETDSRNGFNDIKQIVDDNASLIQGLNTKIEEIITQNSELRDKFEAEQLKTAVLGTHTNLNQKICYHTSLKLQNIQQQKEIDRLNKVLRKKPIGTNKQLPTENSRPNTSL